MAVIQIPNDVSNVGENPYVTLWIKDNILFCTYKNKLRIDLNIAKECVAFRLEYTKGVSYPVYVDMKGIISVTREGREYFSLEGSKLIKAGAFMVNSPLAKIIGNIFLTVNKPPVPAKLFTNEADAINWLKNYL